MINRICGNCKKPFQCIGECPFLGNKGKAVLNTINACYCRACFLKVFGKSHVGWKNRKRCYKKVWSVS